jgi:hypothetical protein
VTSTPAKIQDALMASLNVLRNVRQQPITQRELVRAKRTLITRHDSDLKVSGGGVRAWICVCVALERRRFEYAWVVKKAGARAGVGTRTSAAAPRLLPTAAG